MDPFSIEYALLSMQRALLGEVTPELRAVVIDLTRRYILYPRSRGCIFYAYIYYEREASERQIDLWDCVVTEASCSLGPDCYVKSKILRLDFPLKLPVKGSFAYMRKENKPLPSFPHIKIKERSIGYALIAVQQALLGCVTPELRAVNVDFDTGEEMLHIHFFYDGYISSDLLDLWSSAMLVAKRDFFGGDGKCDNKVERIDYPNPMPFRGRYAYKRKEQRHNDSGL